MKQGEEAIDLYQNVPEDSPLHESSEIQAALILDTTGQADEAFRRLRNLVAKHPADPGALTALANLERAHKQYAAAAVDYTKALTVSPASTSNWVLYYFRGISEERQKNWPPAEADFDKALELYPDQPMVLNYLGYSLADMGRNLDKAFEMLKKAVELEPNEGYIVDSLGWAYYKLGNYSEATKELERAIELDPSDSELNDHLGDLYWRTGHKLEAIWQWNHARDYNPDPADLPGILEKIKNGLPDTPAANAAADVKKNGG